MSEKPIPRGGHAVMAQRREPPDSVEFFPTPPWASRALFRHVLGVWDWGSIWEPACGEGHMSRVLEEFCPNVIATDIHPYGGNDLHDFLDEYRPAPAADWIITNPPFRTSVDFTLRALALAKVGVAMLVRLQWIEGKDRHKRLFTPAPPTVFAPFVERVPMVKGRWDPEASTATSYAWFVWLKPPPERWAVRFIPYGCRTALTKPDDARRFASTELPLWAAAHSVGG